MFDHWMRFRKLCSRVGLSRCQETEGGSALLEAAFALSILMLVMAPAAVMTDTALRVGGDTEIRVDAAAVASSQLDALAAMPFSQIPLGLTVEKTSVGTEVFTIDQDVEPAGIGSSTDCVTGNSQWIVRATEVVLWPALGSWPAKGSGTPVTETTTINPPAVAFNPSTGSVSVIIKGALNQPEGGVPVSLSGATPPTENSTNDGCAFFDNLTAGSYTVSLSGSGMVSDQENTTPTSPVTVVAGQTTSVQFAYDDGSFIDADLSTPDAPQPAQGLGVSFGNPQVQPSGWMSAAAGSTNSPPLFPYPSGYSVWAGQCEESDPQGTDSSGQPLYPGAAAPVPVSATAQSTTTATVSLNSLAVYVTSGGSPVPGATVTAVNDGTGCPTTSLTLATTDTNGNSVTGMPLGHFAITAQYKSGSVTESGSVSIWITPSGIQDLSTGVTLSGPLPVAIS